MPLSYTQIRHVSRSIQQWISKIQVGVVGGYHGGNLGDMALGEAVKSVLSSQGIDSGLQTIYNLQKWPKAPFAIVGGGAVGYADSLSHVAERYKGKYNKVGLLGVDFNEESYPSSCVNLVRNAAFVSCRSKEQAERLIKLTGRKQVLHHPDIAFSLLREFCLEQRENIGRTKSKKLLLINVLPLYGQIINGQIFPSGKFKNERPELHVGFQTMQNSYKVIISSIVNKALKEGYAVETIPFTPQDKEFGEILLEDLPVKHNEYHPDPLKMLNKIATADWVIATRLHATIFALKAGVQLTPIAYATKNELMLQELGIKRQMFLSTTDLANGCTQVPEPIRVDSEVISACERSSHTAINECIASLMLSGVEVSQVK